MSVESCTLESAVRRGERAAFTSQAIGFLTAQSFLLLLASWHRAAPWKALQQLNMYQDLSGIS